MREWEREKREKRIVFVVAGQNGVIVFIIQWENSMILTLSVRSCSFCVCVCVAHTQCGNIPNTWSATCNFSKRRRIKITDLTECTIKINNHVCNPVKSEQNNDKKALHKNKYLVKQCTDNTLTGFYAIFLYVYS